MVAIPAATSNQLHKFELLDLDSVWSSGVLPVLEGLDDEDWTLLVLVELGDEFVFLDDDFFAVAFLTFDTADTGSRLSST